jgi:hypothetical protein
MLTLLAALLVSAEARANNIAPMCDETASSISGPIPALPNQTGEIRAEAPCKEAFMSLDAAPAQDRTGTEAGLTPGKRAVGSRFAWPKLRGVTIPVPRAELFIPPAEHRAAIYRPPQA